MSELPLAYDKQAVRDLYTQLANANAVAEQLGVPVTTVRRYCADIKDQVTAEVKKKYDHRAAVIVATRRSLRAGQHVYLETQAARADMALASFEKAIRGQTFKELNEQEPPFIHVVKKQHEQLRAREMKLAGHSHNHIARTLGVAKSSVSLWCRDLDAPDAERAPVVVDEKLKAKVRELYRTGITAQQVAERLGIGAKRVGEWCADIIAARKASEEHSRRLKKIAEKSAESHLKLTDTQVIELRKDIHENGKKPWRVYAERYGVSISTVTIAARGVTFKHLNDITAPVPDTVLAVARIRKNNCGKIRPDEDLLKEALRLRRSDPGVWTYGKIAQRMKEKTGRNYRGNHIAIALKNRDPSIKDLEVVPEVKVKKPKPPVVQKLPRRKFRRELTAADILERRKKDRQRRLEIKALMEAEDRRDADIARMSSADRSAWEASFPQM